MRFFAATIGFLLLAGCTANTVPARQNSTNAPTSSAASKATDRDIPLSDTESRPKPLHFGLYVTPDPAQNPIDPPERFTVYHTGLDIELLAGEEDEEVPVSALCDGDVIYSDEAEGYGGVVVQTCKVNDQNVTVLYGHLLLSSLVPIERHIARGQRIGMLAPARSRDSGQTRKHLHIGVHKGNHVELLGYVTDASFLQEFIDPSTLL